MLIKLALLLAQCAHWFNPAAYLLNRDASRLCEEACDASLARRMDSRERRLYAETILFCAEMDKTARAPLCAGMTAAGCLKRRLLALARYKRVKRAMALVSVAAAVALAGGGLAARAAFGVVETEKPAEAVGAQAVDVAEAQAAEKEAKQTAEAAGAQTAETEAAKPAGAQAAEPEAEQSADARTAEAAVAQIAETRTVANPAALVAANAKRARAVADENGVKTYVLNKEEAIAEIEFLIAAGDNSGTYTVSGKILTNDQLLDPAKANTAPNCRLGVATWGI
jgi:hypothetical protein